MCHFLQLPTPWTSTDTPLPGFTTSCYTLHVLALEYFLLHVIIDRVRLWSGDHLKSLSKLLPALSSQPHSLQSIHGCLMEEGDNPHLSIFENFTSRIKSLELNISPENLSGWEDWEELNATLNMFGRDKKHLDGTAYSVILICYIVVVIIAGET